MKSVGEFSRVCSQIVLKCIYLTRFGRLDFLWSVNKLARSITKWTEPCDNRLNRCFTLITHVKTNSIVMCVILQNNVDWDCFKTLTLTLREILKIRIRLLEEYRAFWKSYICSNELDGQETDFFGYWIKIRRVVCSGVMGSIVSVSGIVIQTSNKTGWLVDIERKIFWEDQHAQEYWQCSFKRPFFASRSFVVCVRRQWSSNQDDH